MSKPVAFSEEGARRMIAATKAHEAGSRNMPPVKFRSVGGDDGGGQVRLGKTTAAWAKGSVATIDVWGSGTPPSETQTSGETLQAVNKFASVASGRWVLVAQASNGVWYLVEYEESSGACTSQIGSYQLSDIPLYDATKTQILSHKNGCLSWINTTTCPTT
jgi:hypothetical protein